MTNKAAVRPFTCHRESRKRASALLPRHGMLAPLYALLLLLAPWPAAAAVVITTNTTINDGDTSLDGEDIIVQGAVCNPADKAAVEPPRESTAVIDGSAAATGKSLLCYGAKLASKVSDQAAATLAGVSTGTALKPRQAAHGKRTAKAGNPLRTAPGNQFPSPYLLDTVKPALVCLPTDVLGVEPKP
jgi:hypothetical protein